MSRVDKAAVRDILFMPAMVAIHHNPPVIALAQRLEARGKPKMVIIGAAMHKLLHIAYGVLKKSPLPLTARLHRQPPPEFDATTSSPPRFGSPRNFT